MRSNKIARFFAAIAVVGFTGAVVPNGSAFAYNLSTANSSTGSHSTYNALAPEYSGAVGSFSGDGSITKAPGRGNTDRLIKDRIECAHPDAETPTWSASGVYLGYTCQFSPGG